MSSHWLFLLQSICKFGGLLLALIAPSLLNAQSATAPTTSDDPASIDQIWEKASSKYDSERAARLDEVDKVDHEGPFRPDWESLQKYEVPAW